MAEAADKSDNEVTLESMVSVLRTFLHSHWSQIMSAFYYFCSLHRCSLKVRKDYVAMTRCDKRLEFGKNFSVK